MRGESDSVLPRGIARFPKNAELLALQATALRAEGRTAEALSATRQAVALEPLLPQGELAIAQAEIDLGRPDSALAALHRLVERTVERPAFAAGAAAAADPPIVADTASSAPDNFATALPPTLTAPTIGTPATESRPTFQGAQRDSVRAMVAAFALAKGNQLLRAADATRDAGGYRLAAASSRSPTRWPDADDRLLVGMASLGLAKRR